MHTESALDFDAWRVLGVSLCGQCRDDSASAKDFVGSLRTPNVCGFSAVDVTSNIHRRIDRTQRHVRVDGLDHYRAIFQVAGRSTFVQNDRVMELAFGDVALVDLTQPLTYVSGGVRRIVTFMLPRQSIVSHLGLEPRRGSFKCGETLAKSALFRLILDAVDEGDPSLVAAEPYMHLAVYDLVGALLTASDLPLDASPADRLFARICSIINAHFVDPDIGPPDVAAEAGISLRYLQKLFALRGMTCSLFIQSLRLDHAAHLLQRRALTKTDQPISEIAYACGFRNYAHFNQAFRRRFGRTPGSATGL